jgi:hypothetical protein
MGNAQSQNPSSHRDRIQKLPGKIAAKLPAVTPLGRAKDSGYRSGSASSSGTAVKGGRANDQTSSTVVGTGSDKGPSRPEAVPAAAERRSDAPAPVTETVRRMMPFMGGGLTDIFASLPTLPLSPPRLLWRWLLPRLPSRVK